MPSYTPLVYDNQPFDIDLHSGGGRREREAQTLFSTILLRVYDSLNVAREKLELELEYYSCMGLGRSILVRVKIRKEHRSSANLFYRHALLPRKGSLRFHFQREIEFITPPPISSLSSAPEARK